MSEAGALPAPRILAPAGYELDGIIGRGTTSTVFRAVAPDNQVVALKIARAYDVAIVNQLRAEITMLRRVHHPRVIGLRDAGEHNGLPWYTMDLLPGRTLADAVSEHLPGVEQAVIIMCHLVAALDAIHALGFVHADLKPENVFLDEAGIPIIGDLNLVYEGTRGLSGGTPLFAAPEQIRGESLDARTDFYALGCIAHVLITGHPPFTDPATLLADHLQKPPPRLAAPEPLADMVDSLLAKQRSDRPGYAIDLEPTLHRWCTPTAACEQASAARLYNPSLQGRTGLLQAFRRYASFDALGGAVMVAGESGTGKSALAERLKELLNDQGWRVVAIQTTDTPGPLSPLRPLVQAMIDACWFAGPELAQQLFGPDGGTLRNYHPGINDLPGFESPKPVPLSTLTGRPELLRDLERGLVEFARDRRVALIIDDAHRLDELTLAFLARVMCNQIYNAGVLFVGLYRPDAGSLLEPLLTSAETHELQPLSDAAVRRMVTEMLASTEAPEHLLSALIREAQGNPFYVTEYLRMAVDQGLVVRSHLAWVAPGNADYLPMPDSIQALMRERLVRLTANATELITIAALIGGEIAPDLIIAAAALDPAASTSSIDELLRTGMLAHTETELLYFRHDRLRSYVLDQQPPDPARSQRIAQALEQHHFGRAEYADQFATIADHWHAAGNSDMAASFYARAGAHALEHAAYKDAIGHYKRALDASSEVPGPARDTAAARASLLYRLGIAQHSAGDLDAAGATMTEALSVFGVHLPTTRAGWAAALLGELAARVVTPLRITSGNASQVAEQVRATAFMSERYFFENDLLKVYTLALMSINTGNRVEGALSARPYAILAFAAGTAGLRRRARGYFARSLAIADAAQEPADRAYASLAASLYHAGQGRWADARRTALNGLAATDVEVDPENYENLTSCLTSISFYQGHFDESLTRAADFRKVAEQRDNTPRQAWAWAFAARVALVRGEYHSASKHLDRAAALGGDAQDGFVEIMVPGLRSLTLVHLGELEAAAAAAETALERLRGGWATNCSTREAYLATASTFRLLGNPHGEQQSVAELVRFARLFPMARVSARLFQNTQRRRSLSTRQRKQLLKQASRHTPAYDEVLIRQCAGVDPDPDLAGLREQLSLPDDPVF